MDKIYKLFGIVIPLASIAVAYLLVTNFDLRSITTENDFVTAILHSDSLYQLSERGKIMLGTAISVLGFCFGLISFGIGLTLTKLKEMSVR